MMYKLKQVFKKENHIIIGMVHFPPLLGYRDFPGISICLNKSLQDAKILDRGGTDAIMVENNYDTPHKVFVEVETVASMTYLIKGIKDIISIPIGISVLWNDYKAAFAMAKICGCQFIRVPVFVDSVKTQYGNVLAGAKKVLFCRKEFKTENTLIFADIHVKHAEMLRKKTITQSAREAVKAGADGLIITGKWTGDIPDIKELKEARVAVGENFPVFVGSGATKKNAGLILQYANGIIVGTSLKTGKTLPKENEINLKPWQEKISLEKTKAFMRMD